MSVRMVQGTGAGPAGAELETLVLRKIAARIVPFVIALYFVSFLNRVNVGFAALTMDRDLGLSAQMFGVGAGIFFVGYLLFGLPSNLLLERIGARRMISLMMLAWGVLSGATAFVTGAFGFCAMRFAVGLAEAGFFPGIILYLSFWFPARRRAGVIALFMAAAPISNMVSAPISGAILEMNGFMHLKGWQWLFLLEAAPTVVLGVVAYFFLTDKPELADWLKHEERGWLVEEMARELEGKSGKKAVRIWSALANPRVLGLALAYFGSSTGLYAVSIWTPLFLSRFGYSYVALGLLTAIPNGVAVVGMVAWARSSDRRNERRLHCSIACPGRGRGDAAGRLRRRRGAADRGALAGGLRHRCGQAAAVEHADAVPLRAGSSRGDRADQRSGQRGRDRGPHRHRPAQGGNRLLLRRDDLRGRHVDCFFDRGFVCRAEEDGAVRVMCDRCRRTAAIDTISSQLQIDSKRKGSYRRDPYIHDSGSVQARG